MVANPLIPLANPESQSPGDNLLSLLQNLTASITVCNHYFRQTQALPAALAVLNKSAHCVTGVFANGPDADCQYFTICGNWLTFPFAVRTKCLSRGKSL